MKTKNNTLLSVFSFGIIIIFALILIFPASREVFKTLSSIHPFLMGFIKFALLATIGEIFALRISKGIWQAPTSVFTKFIIWGLIGVWITFMMKVFSNGIGALMEGNVLPNPENPFLKKFLKALFTSATMNLTFGPTFMAVHKCSDKFLQLKSESKECNMKSVITGIDWSVFVGFTLFKTVPIFWIPAHTITFMLPGEYQVIMAAALSVALGIILSLKK